MNMQEEIIYAYLRIRSSKLTCSVSEIASEVGLSKSGLYHYFTGMSELEEKSVSYCMKIISSSEIKVDFSCKDLPSLVGNLLIVTADVFCAPPLCWFFAVSRQSRLCSPLFADASHKISMMVCARIRVALEYAVQESKTDIRDTDSASSLLTLAFMEVLASKDLALGVPQDDICELVDEFLASTDNF